MPIPAETTRLSSKGQVVLPSSICHARHRAPGTEFVVHETPEGILLKPVKGGTVTRVEDVAGCLKPRRPRVSLVDIEAAIANETNQRHARGRY